MKKIIVVFSLVCFLTETTFAGKVFLISPLTEVHERNLPLKLSSDIKSFSSYYLENYPQKSNVENLLKEFENAQKYYLVKSHDLAIRHYQRVIQMSGLDEWKDLHRKIIYLSFIRLAELDGKNQIQWIRNALKFSFEIDPNKLEISKGLIKTIAGVKKEFSNRTILWPINELKNDFRYILMNGHTIDLRKIDHIKIPAGQFRITFLSDIYRPQTYHVSSQQVPLLVPTRIPFVSGNCDKPSFDNEGEIEEEVLLYFSKNCLLKRSGRNWVAYNKASERKEFSLEPSYVAPAPLVSKVEREKEPIYKNKWFLVTLGALAVGATLYATQNKKEKPTHETVSGY